MWQQILPICRHFRILWDLNNAVVLISLAPPFNLRVKFVYFGLISYYSFVSCSKLSVNDGYIVNFSYFNFLGKFKIFLHWCKVILEMILFIILYLVNLSTSFKELPIDKFTYQGSSASSTETDINTRLA